MPHQEWLPGQTPQTRERTKEAQVTLVSEPVHPRQLRRAEVGLVGDSAYVGLGNGRYLQLSFGGESGGSGTTSTPIAPGGMKNPKPVTPGGSDGDVQYNNAGTFGGFGDYDAATDLLTIAQVVVSNYLEVPEVRAPDDLTLSPDGDAVVIPEGKQLIFNG